MSTQTKPATDSITMKFVIEEIKRCARQNDMLKTSRSVALLRDRFALTAKESQFKLSKANCHISLPHIYNLLKLNDAPKKVHKHIDEGKINSTQVLSLMHKHQEPEELIEDVEVNILMLEQADANSKVKLQQKETDKAVEEVVKVFNKVIGPDITKKIPKNSFKEFTKNIMKIKLLNLTHDFA